MSDLIWEEFDNFLFFININTLFELVFIGTFTFLIINILQIYDGKDKTTHLLGAFTGASMRGLTLSSTSNQLWLEFNSDSEGTDEGFQLVYTSKYFRRKKWPNTETEYLLNNCNLRGEAKPKI